MPPKNKSTDSPQTHEPEAAATASVKRIRNPIVPSSYIRDAIEANDLKKARLLLYRQEKQLAKIEEQRMSKPKKQPSLFNLFIRDTMPEMKRDFPELHNNDLLKKCTEKWNEQKLSKAVAASS
jgi:hypothetical protein